MCLKLKIKFHQVSSVAVDDINSKIENIESLALKSNARQSVNKIQSN